MDLDLNCKKVEIKPSSRNDVNVIITDVDEDSVIDMIHFRKFVDHFEPQKLLDYISDDDIINYLKAAGYIFIENTM